MIVFSVLPLKILYRLIRITELDYGTTLEQTKPGLGTAGFPQLDTKIKRTSRFYNQISNTNYSTTKGRLLVTATNTMANTTGLQTVSYFYACVEASNLTHTTCYGGNL